MINSPFDVAAESLNLEGQNRAAALLIVAQSCDLKSLTRFRFARFPEAGYLTGGSKRNREYLNGKMAVDPSIREGLVETALDPQTSGGLLIALPEKDAGKLVKELRANGVESASTIGHAVPSERTRVRLV